MENIPSAFKPQEAEQQKLDPQELLRKMTTMPETPGALRKTLSTDNVKTFLEIITSPEAVEANWLFLCGDLTAEQANQYRMTTGGYHACLQRLSNLSVKISDDFRPRLVQMIKNDIRGLKKEGAYNLLNSLGYLSRINTGADDFRDSIGGNAYLAEPFFFQALALIGSDLIDITEDHTIAEDIRKKTDRLIQDWRDLFDKNLGTPFPGDNFHDEKKRLNEILEKRENLATLDNLLNLSNDFNEEDRFRINEENNRFIATIGKEVLYKKIPFITLNKKSPQVIAIKNNDFDIDGLIEESCSVRINFGETDIDFPPLKKGSAGDIYREYEVLPDVIDFELDPRTGNLYFISMGAGGGQLIDKFISKDRYLALQNYMFRKIKDYLESKDPDIEDLFFYSPSELKILSDKIESEARQPEESLDDSIPENIEEPTETEPYLYIPAERDQEFQESPNNKSVLPKHFRVAVMDRISGSKADAVIAALRRLIGKEEKAEGSHLMFRSQRNGMVLPVPLHSQKDRNHISLPLILSNLKQWQYDPIELAMELGLKIPRRFMGEL